MSTTLSASLAAGPSLPTLAVSRVGAKPLVGLFALGRMSDQFNSSAGKGPTFLLAPESNYAAVD